MIQHKQPTNPRCVKQRHSANKHFLLDFTCQIKWSLKKKKELELHLLDLADRWGSERRVSLWRLDECEQQMSQSWRSCWVQSSMDGCVSGDSSTPSGTGGGKKRLQNTSEIIILAVGSWHSWSVDLCALLWSDSFQTIWWKITEFLLNAKREYFSWFCTVYKFKWTTVCCRSVTLLLPIQHLSSYLLLMRQSLCLCPTNLNYVLIFLLAHSQWEPVRMEHTDKKQQLVESESTMEKYKLWKTEHLCNVRVSLWSRWTENYHSVWRFLASFSF